jgi:hypothetical protein
MPSSSALQLASGVQLCVSWMKICSRLGLDKALSLAAV